MICNNLNFKPYPKYISFWDVIPKMGFSFISNDKLINFERNQFFFPQSHKNKPACFLLARWDQYGAIDFRSWSKIKSEGRFLEFCTFYAV